MSTSEFVFGAPPPATEPVAPTDEQVELFDRNGFLVVDQLTSEREVEWLKGVIDDLMASGRAFVFEPGADLGKPPPFGLAQAVHPEVQYPELLQSSYVRNVKQFAAALLQRSVEDVSAWGYALRMPNGGTEIGWHQDEAYWLPELDYDAVVAWLPVGPATPPDHDIEFLTGSHRRGVRRHDHAASLETSLLRADVDVEEARVASIDLPVGGATFHNPRTLLRVRPRSSTERSDVYAVCAQTAPTRRRRRRRWPWVEQQRQVVGDPPDPLTYVADGRIAVARS